MWFMYHKLRPFEVIPIVLVAVNLSELKPCLLCGGQQPRCFNLSWLLGVRPSSTHVVTGLPGIRAAAMQIRGSPSVVLQSCISCYFLAVVVT